MARFTRTVPAPEVKRPYGDFRPYVRSDFEQCCAYCYLHERHASGVKSFEIDHFCPRKECPDLFTNFYNLYWACGVCNGLQSKRNQWPSKALREKGIGFVDLCKDNFEDHYEVEADGRLKPLTKSAEYTIDAIDLNSEHLIKIRALLRYEKKPLDKEPL